LKRDFRQKHKHGGILVNSQLAKALSLIFITSMKDGIITFVHPHQEKQKLVIRDISRPLSKTMEDRDTAERETPRLRKVTERGKTMFSIRDSLKAFFSILRESVGGFRTPSTSVSSTRRKTIRRSFPSILESESESGGSS
jgi:hypothetical protein